MPAECSIPPYLQAKVDHELDEGERVQWVGAPIPGYFTPGATATFVFGTLWTTFMVSWMIGVTKFTIEESSPHPLFGVPFLLLGIYMQFSPWRAHRRFVNTAYVITDRRALTFHGGRSTTIRSYRPDRLEDIYRREKRNGTGDVIITRRVWRGMEGDPGSEDLGFLRISNPREVERMLNELAKETDD